ncbi:hypothetical protein D3C84_961500 [compost metagenome]
MVELLWLVMELPSASLNEKVADRAGLANRATSRQIPKDLSVNNIDRQPDLAQRDDRRGQLVEGEVAVSQFLVPHQEFAKTIEPTVTGLDHPAARLLARVAS